MVTNPLGCRPRSAVRATVGQLAHVRPRGGSTGESAAVIRACPLGNFYGNGSLGARQNRPARPRRAALDLLPGPARPTLSLRTVSVVHATSKAKKRDF